MLQHENRHISEMRDYFCTKRCSFVLHTTLHKYVASCCIYLMYAKLTETQVLRTNFATDKDSCLPNNPDLNPLTTICEEPCWRSFRSWNWNRRTWFGAADYLKRSAWRNNSQIYFQLLHTTHDMQQHLINIDLRR